MLTIGIASFLVAIALDRFTILETGARVAISLAALTVTLVTAVVTFAIPLFKRRANVDIARRLERLQPDFEGGLLSLVELFDAPAKERSSCSPALLEDLAERCAARCSSVDLSSALPWRRSLTAAVSLGVTILLLSTLAIRDRSTLSQLGARFARPTANLTRPSTIRLFPITNPHVVARGSDLDIVWSVDRGDVDSAMVFVRASDSGEQTWTELDARYEPSRQRFTRTFSTVDQSFEYKIRAGDFESASYRIEVRDPPRPTSYEVEYRFPEYTELPPHTVQQTRADLVAIRGTVASVRIHTSLPATRADVRLGTDTTLAANASSSQTLLVEGVPIDQDNELIIRVFDADDLTHAEELRYSVRALRDRAPTAAIVRPRKAEVDVEVGSVLPIQYRVEDDVAISSVEILLGNPESPVRRVSIYSTDEDSPPTKLLDDEHPLAIADLRLLPGQSGTVTIEARDGLGQSAKSKPRRLRMAYPPTAPEGREWLDRLRRLDEGIRHLASEWMTLESKTDATNRPDARSETLERVVALRVYAVRWADTAVELGERIETPSPLRTTLGDLGLTLQRFANGEAAEYWERVVSSTPDGLPGADEDAADRSTTHALALERLGELRASVSSIVIAEELEESSETIRLLSSDLSGLLATSSTGQDLTRAAGLRDSAVMLAADLVGLANRHEEHANAERWRKISSSVLTSVAQEIDAARASNESGQSAASRASIVLARDASLDRRLQLRVLWAQEEQESRASRRSLAVDESLFDLAEKWAKSFRDDESSAAREQAKQRLLTSRDLFAWIDETIRKTQSFEYSDFESLALLTAIRAVVENALEQDLSREKQPTPSRHEVFDRIAEVCRAIEPVIRTGHAIQSVDWIATGQEDLAWRMRAADASRARLWGTLTRAQRDLTSALEDERRRTDDRSAAVAHLDRALGSARESRAALERPASTEQLGLATDAAQLTLRELEAARSALENTQREHVVAAEKAREWIAAQRGSIEERLTRLADELESRAKDIRSTATGKAASDAKLDDEIDAWLIAQDDTSHTLRDIVREIRSEADALADRGRPPESIETLRRSSHELTGALSSELVRASRDLRAARTTDREDRVLLFSSAADALAAAADRIRKIREALVLLSSEALQALDSEESRAMIEAARKLAENPTDDPKVLRERATAFLSVTRRALEVLGARLGDSIGKRQLVDLLVAARERFYQSIAHVDGGRIADAAASLQAGLTRLDAAIALLEKLRGEATESLERDTSNPKDPGNDEKKNAADRERLAALEAARRELDKLLQSQAAVQAAKSMLDELLADEKAAQDPERRRKATEAAQAAADSLEKQIASEEKLLEIVSSLLAIDRDGRAITEEERYLEEEARKIAADRDRDESVERLSAELAPRQSSLLLRFAELSEKFDQIGFQVSLVLPEIFTAFRRAAAHRHGTDESLSAARTSLENKDVESSVERLEQANLRLGEFFARVDATRRRTLEAIADLRGGGGGRANAALRNALRNAQEAAKLISSGKIGQARQRQSASLADVSVALRAVRKHADDIVLPSGPEGALLSKLLEAEAAKHGLVWNVETRGEEFVETEVSVDDLEKAFDMPYPDEFRDLVRLYLRALREQR